MKIEFLGHAGFHLDCNGKTILIDPWLTSSNFSDPFIESIVPAHKTIDYLIPEPVRTRESIKPDIILISHFHAHHSPKLDILFWLEKSDRKIRLIGPEDQKGKVSSFFQSLREQFPQHEFEYFKEDFLLETEVLKIQGLTHPCVEHFSYFIKTTNQHSFLHIADAKINRLDWDRRMDMLWLKYRDLNPSFMALSAGTGSMRKVSAKGNYIIENVFMSPVEAALLTAEIQPKVAALIGIYNFSIWKNRNEYFYSAAESEAYFAWAVRHLNTDIKTLALRPGMILSPTQDSFSLNL